jgi:hypothetical protein
MGLDELAPIGLDGCNAEAPRGICARSDRIATRQNEAFDKTETWGIILAMSFTLQTGACCCCRQLMTARAAVSCLAEQLVL